MKNVTLSPAHTLLLGMTTALFLAALISDVAYAQTFEIQWANKDEDPTASDISELAAEQKQTFKDVVDSFEALARTFAKQDSAI